MWSREAKTLGGKALLMEKLLVVRVLLVLEMMMMLLLLQGLSAVPLREEGVGVEAGGERGRERVEGARAVEIALQLRQRQAELRYASPQRLLVVEGGVESGEEARVLVPEPPLPLLPPLLLLHHLLSLGVVALESLLRLRHPHLRPLHRHSLLVQLALQPGASLMECLGRGVERL
mmetsp:Transcript_25120/g.59586  ORF Transcript_25120/g.59586 Transcript_25120/m.59586 type:complete len:175 (-) Transcript_25120:247-771(-)